ncbi:MAG: penicillin-binding protein 1C, partial [Thiohalocapsa sp.]
MAIQVAHTSPPSLDFKTSPVVLDRDERLLRAFTVADGRWRLPAGIADVDPRLIDLLLAFEDRRFYTHAGVDPLALGRALWQALRHGRIVSGGSTLTMQVARLRGTGSTRTLVGKWRQLSAALALERVTDKATILRAYLNLAPYGGNLEGVRSASLAWLGKEPGRLTPAEAALLVALPQSPRARRPDLHPQAARRGRDRVLMRAAALGVIDAETLAAALSEPLPTRRRPFPILAPHAARRAVVTRPELDTHRLTIDAELQARLETLAAEHAALLPEGTSVALLAAEHRTGAIRAAVGSAALLDRERGGFVDMTHAPRSPGSTLKPLIYGLAFEQGLAHPESLIEDRPSGFGAYTPTNFDREFQGTVTLREALQQSLNVPAVALLDAVGPARLLARLRRAGAEPRLPGEAPPGLAIGLGGVGLTLRDLVATYAAIARGGRPVALRESRDVPANAASSQPVLEARACWYLTSILSGADSSLRGGGKVALKTGTSYGYRDAWAIGFDGRYVIGVWAGRPDGAPVPGLTGAKSAVPLLRDAFARLGVMA